MRDSPTGGRPRHGLVGHSYIYTPALCPLHAWGQLRSRGIVTSQSPLRLHTQVGSDTPWRRYPCRAPCRCLYVEWLLATVCPFRPSSRVPSRCFLFLVQVFVGGRAFSPGDVGRKLRSQILYLNDVFRVLPFLRVGAHGACSMDTLGQLAGPVLHVLYCAQEGQKL